ncbi:MAG: alpha/beta hydrolase [Phycisphaerae bacterium]
MSIGCIDTTQQYNGQGVVFYLDGSGGGGPITRWSDEVEDGLLRGGFKGTFNEFTWNTGFGMLADHISRESYKRERAADLNGYIVEHARDEPDDPIYLVAYSAGCAVAVYALEALPDEVMIERVVLLAPSVSQSYDLRSALRRVRHTFWVSRSPHDRVLREALPLTGTADGKYDKPAGLDGFVPQVAESGVASDLPRGYEKIQYLSWQPSFMAEGFMGDHMDIGQSRFIELYVAPLLTDEP